MNTRICGINIMLLSAFMILSLLAAGTPAAEAYEVEFSTYIGGSGYEHIRDICADKQGNVYIVGGTTSSDYPTTPDAYQRTHGGMFDIFVTKFDHTGDIIWSTLVGGKDYDRGYAIEVDDQGYVYVAGRAGEGFPTTPGVVQGEFAGDSNPPGAYGKQDGFVTKLSPDGSTILWSTYFGDSGGSIIRDIDIDDYGNVYITLMGVSVPSPYITSGAFQTELSGGRDNVIAKLSSDGSRIIWASYLGGSGNDI